MIHEPSDPGAADLNYDDLDDGRGIILWLCIAMAATAFAVMVWLIYEVTKAEPYAAAGREIHHYIKESPQ